MTTVGEQADRQRRPVTLGRQDPEEASLPEGGAVMAVDPIASQGLVTALATGLATGETSLEEYAAFVDASWRAYTRMRRACYAAEERWVDAPFWRRRREAAIV